MDPKTQKQLTYGGAAILAAFIGYKMFFDNDQGGSANDPTGNGTVNPGSGSAPAFNASKTAKELYDAMKDPGTSETDILAALQRVNASQFDQVFAAFGAKQYNLNLGSQWNLVPFTQLPYVNLKGWLKNELSDEEYALLRLKYPTKL
ncbi:MAG TPA: hypothetical protein VF581_07725 [Flavobacterium sp.]|jgi:hypothetical protein